MYYNVRHAEPAGGKTIYLEFEDGRRGTFDMTRFLDWPIFRPLNSDALFARVRAKHGTAVWPGDIDISPERLWEECVPVAEEVVA